MEHVWAKIPQFHRRLVGWAGATVPPAHNKSMDAHFGVVRTIRFSKIYVMVLYMSFHSYRVVFCAPIPMGPRTPDFGSCSMSYILQTTLGMYSGISGPVYRPTGMSAR